MGGKIMKTKMEITLIKQIPQIETIEVELPHYYKHDLTDDYSDLIIYGKIEEKLHTSFHETKRYDGMEAYEIEKERHSSIENSGLSDYFDEEYQSNKEEFEAVKERCLLFLSGC